MEKFRKADWQLLLAEITVRGWAGSAIDDPWLATDRLHKWHPHTTAFAQWLESPDEIVSFFVWNKDGRLRLVLETVLPDVQEALWRVPRARLR